MYFFNFKASVLLFLKSSSAHLGVCNQMCSMPIPSQTWNKESLKKRFNSLKNLHFVEDFVKIKKKENKNQKKIILLYFRK